MYYRERSEWERVSDCIDNISDEELQYWVQQLAKWGDEVLAPWLQKHYPSKR